MKAPGEQMTTFHLDGFCSSILGENRQTSDLTTKQAGVIILFPDQIRLRGMRDHQRDYLGGTETGSFIK